MKQLSSEILVNIFLYLHPKNKVDCMLVCQHWKHVIEEFALFHALDIRSGTSLKKLTGILEENLDIRKKVEHLTIFFIGLDSKVDLNGLLLLLPNIRTLYCNGTEYEDVIITEEVTYPWSRHIQLINEFTSGSITSTLLLFNICSKLTTINLDYSPDNIILLLKNAPVLKNLRLCIISISFDDLETLHENTPCLESFTAHSLKLEESIPSYHIKPAVSVTECHFEDVVVTRRNSRATKQLLTYASKKYPNLSKFTYTFYSDHIKKKKNANWLPLLQNLGPKLKRLSVSTNGWADNTSDILDRCNCEIEYFRICGLSSTACMKIVQSQQIYYIQTIVLILIDFRTYSWLNELQTLKTLKLFLSPCVEEQACVELEDVISNSPLTLRSLSLFRVRLTADPKYIGLSNIECLSFDDVELSEGIDTFISQHFPKLTKLKLKKCNMIGDTFNLEKMDLLNFTYHAQFLKSKYANILIVTSYNNERRWYTLKYGLQAERQRNGFYPPVKSRPRSGVDIEPEFILLCNSFNKCILI